MSTNNPANSAALLDAMGNQLLPNTRAELVWVKATGSGSDKKAAPFDVPGGEPKDIRLSALLAETVYLGNTQTITGQKTFSLNIQLASGKGVVGAFGTNYRNLVTANGSDTISVGDSEVANTNIVAKTSTTIKYGANTIATFNVNGVNGTNFIHGNGGAYKGITTAGQTIGLIRAADGNVTIGDHQNNGIKGLVSNTEVYNATKSKTTFTATDSIEGKIGSDVVTVTNSKGFYSNGGVAAMGILEAGEGGGGTSSLAGCVDVKSDNSGNVVRTDGSLSQIGDALIKLSNTHWGAKSLFDSSGKILLSNLPDAILGQVLFGGTVAANAVATLTANAQAKLGVSSATLTLTNTSTGDGGYKKNEGIYYIADADLTFAGLTFKVGDWLVSTGNGWKKVDNTDAVTSVVGQTGAVTAEQIATAIAPIISLSSYVAKSGGTMSGTLNFGSNAYGITNGGVATLASVTATTFTGALKGNADSATKATQDGNGLNIANTYATKTERANADITAVTLTASKLTLTRADGNLEANVPTWNQDTTGNAGSANKVNKALTIGGKTFDGSSAVSISLTDLNAKQKQSAVSVDGGTLKTLTKIEQNAEGVITPTFSDIQTATTSLKGVTTLSSTIANDETKAATPKAVHTEQEARKAVDLTGIEVGKIAKRNYEQGETPADLTAPALKFNHTSGSIDIARGTDVDINAANLIGEAVPQKDQMFGYRTTAGDASIKPTGTAHIDKLSGNTIVWNQKFVPTQITQNGVTVSAIDSNGFFNITGTANNSGASSASTGIPNTSGHTFLCVFNTTQATTGGFTWWLDSAYTINYIIGSAIGELSKIVKIGSSANILGVINVVKTKAYTWKGRICYFDLTQMFGSDAAICKALGVPNLDTTDNQNKAIANFKAMFPNSYYPYNVGELVSFGGEGVALETIGRNLWDEQWEQGYFDDTTGALISDDSVIRSKNFIRVLPGQKLVSSHSLVHALYFFDSNGGYISFVPTTGNPSITVPTNAAFCKFRCVRAYGGTYNHDICIGLLWSGSRTGYEPYSRHTLPVTPYIPEEFNKTHTYELGDLVLHDGAMYKRTANGGVKKDWASSDWNMVRCAGGGIGQALSAGSVRDEYYDDHCVIRVGSVDMGTQNYTPQTADNPRLSIYLPLLKVRSGEWNQNIMSSNGLRWDITIQSLVPSVDYCIGAYNGTSALFQIKSLVGKTADEIKQALTGVKLYFELAEPITIWYNTKQNFDYFADDYGTEGWIPQTGSTPRFVPPFLDLTYGINVVDEVRSLPNYLKKEDYIRFDHINTDTDDDHREAALVTDTGGNGYVISQLGYKVGSDVYDEVPV